MPQSPAAGRAYDVNLPGGQCNVHLTLTQMETRAQHARGYFIDNPRVLRARRRAARGRPAPASRPAGSTAARTRPASTGAVADNFGSDGIALAARLGRGPRALDRRARASATTPSSSRSTASATACTGSRSRSTATAPAARSTEGVIHLDRTAPTAGGLAAAADRRAAARRLHWSVADNLSGAGAQPGPGQRGRRRLGRRRVGDARRRDGARAARRDRRRRGRRTASTPGAWSRPTGRATPASRRLRTGSSWTRRRRRSSSTTSPAAWVRSARSGPHRHRQPPERARARRDPDRRQRGRRRRRGRRVDPARLGRRRARAAPGRAGRRSPGSRTAATSCGCSSATAGPSARPSRPSAAPRSALTARRRPSRARPSRPAPAASPRPGSPTTRSPASRPRRSSGATARPGGRSRASGPSMAPASMAVDVSSVPLGERVLRVVIARRRRQRRGASGRGAHRAGRVGQHGRRSVRAAPERAPLAERCAGARSQRRAGRRSLVARIAVGGTVTITGRLRDARARADRGRRDPGPRATAGRSSDGRSRAGTGASGSSPRPRPAARCASGSRPAASSCRPRGGRRCSSRCRPRVSLAASSTAAAAGQEVVFTGRLVPAPADIGLGSRKGVVLEWLDPVRRTWRPVVNARIAQNGTFAIPWSFALRGLTIPMRVSVPTEVGWPLLPGAIGGDPRDGEVACRAHDHPGNRDPGGPRGARAEPRDGDRCALAQ